MPEAAARRAEVNADALLEAQGLAARPGPRSPAPPGIEEAVSEALIGPTMLRIHYRGLHDAEARERVVAPHGLLIGQRRYLVAKAADDMEGPMRHFRLDRIEAAEVLGESFPREPGFDIAAHARRAFGAFQREEEYGEVVWRFAPRAAEHARGFEFHPERVMEDQPDGSLVVRFHAAGWLEMCWHLYQWGDAVEVLAPEALRDMVHPWRRRDFPALP